MIHAIHHFSRDLRLQNSLTFSCLPNRLGNFLGCGCLENVTGRPRLHGWIHLGIINKTRQNNNSCLRPCLQNLLGCRDPVFHRHHEIHQNNIRPIFKCHIDTLLTVFGLINHFQIRLDPYVSCQPQPNHFVIINNQYFNHAQHPLIMAP